MTIQYKLPTQAVLSRQLPKKKKLPASELIKGAYVYELPLLNGGVSARVVCHVQVNRYVEILRNLKWSMEPLGDPQEERADFVLKPAGEHAQVTIVGISLRTGPKGSVTKEIVFDSPRDVLARERAQRHSGLLGMLRRVHVVENESLTA